MENGNKGRRTEALERLRRLKEGRARRSDLGAAIDTALGNSDPASNLDQTPQQVANPSAEATDRSQHNSQEATPGKNEPTASPSAENPATAVASDPVFGGEWFAGSTLSSPEDPTPMEQAQIDKIRSEVAQEIERLAADPAHLASIVDSAKDIARGLPKGFATEARRMSLIVQKAAEDMQQLDSTQKQVFVAEALSSIANQKPLADISGHNPIALAYVSDTRISQFEKRASVTEKAQARNVRMPNTKAYAVSGGTALAFALGGYYLEVGTTKTAIIQLNDIYGIPGIRHAIEGLTEQMKSYGWKADDAASAAKVLVGGSLSAYLGGTLFATKSIGLKNLGPVGKAQLYGSLGASLTLGYLALQNFVADTNAVASVGKIASTEFNPIAEKAKEVRLDRAKLFSEVQDIVQKTVEAEVNRPGAPGYGAFSAFVEKGLAGTYDESKFDTFVNTRDAGGQSRIRSDHTRLQSALNPLSQGGLLKILQDAQKKVDLETAPALSDAVVKVGDAASKLTLWSGLGKVLAPLDDVTTSVGVYRQAKDAADAFSKLITDDAITIETARGSVSRHLDAMIAAAGTNTSMVGSLRTLKNTLLQKLSPINVPKDIAQRAVEKIATPSGQWVIFPDDQVWQQMQSTIKDSEPFRSLGWDVSTDSPSHNFWRAGLVALLGGFFLTINGGSYLLSRRLNGKREKKFEGELKEGMEDLNEREAFIATAISALVEKAHKQFLINSGATHLSYPVPSSLVELHVRRELREQYLKEEGSSLSKTERLGWFTHGLAFGKTPQDIRMFVDYNNWLEDKLERMDKNPVDEVENIIHGMYPEFDKTIAANDAVLAANAPNRAGRVAVLESEMRKMRKEQLKTYATLINERLAILNITRSEDEVAPADTDVRLNLEDTKIIVSRDAALSAFAHRNITGERMQLEQTLEYIRRMGIAPESTVAQVNDELTIGGFPLGPKNSLRDQLVRIRAAREMNMPHAEGNADDFERIDQYLTRVAQSLREVRDTVFAGNDQLKELHPEFVWRKSDGGHYTIHIDMYRDENRLQNPVGSLTYNKAIPDFTAKSPEEATQELVQWLQAGGPAIEGLIAQERHAFYQSEHRRLIAEARTIGGGKPELTLVEGGRSTEPSAEALSVFAQAYKLSELLDEQVGSIALARRGIRIEPGKFRAFIEPDAYMSNRRSGNELPQYVVDILSRSYPADIQITYNATTLRFAISRTGRRFRVPGRTTESGEPATIRVRDYKNEALEKAVADISQAQR